MYDLHITGIEGGSALYVVGLDVNNKAESFQATMDAYMKCLLTRRGSDPFDPSYGTKFAELPGSNYGGRLDEASAITSESVKNAEVQIKKYQNSQSLSRTERLASATLTSFQEYGSDGFVCTIALKNQSGQKYTAILPLIEL